MEDNADCHFKRYIYQHVNYVTVLLVLSRIHKSKPVRTTYF